LLPDSCPLNLDYFDADADMSFSNISFGQDSSTSDEISECRIIDEFCNQSFQLLLPDSCPLNLDYYDADADMSFSNISFGQDSANSNCASNREISDTFNNGKDDALISNIDMDEETDSISDNSYERLLDTENGELSSNNNNNEIRDDLTEYDTDDEYFNIFTDDEGDFLTDPDVFNKIGHYLDELNDNECSELDCVQV